MAKISSREGILNLRSFIAMAYVHRIRLKQAC
jgi:hypothetical protein